MAPLAAHVSGMSHRTRSNLVNPLSLALSALILAALGVFAWVWGLNILHLFTTSWREAAIFWTPAFLAVVLAVAFFLVENIPAKATFFVASVFFLIGAISLSVTATHTRLSVYYAQSTKQVEQIAPDYADRVPFEVAGNTSDAEMQDLTGDAQATKSLADLGDHGEWNTLVNTRGPWNGYEAVQTMDLPLFDSDGANAMVDNCRFSPKATLRDSGSLPHNNLSRAIYSLVPLDVDYNSADMYGYCQDDVPYVAVPLYQVQGWWHPVNVFYGVAVYNGSTGDLTIADTNNAVEDIPGPVYPMSLASIQREALAASEGWWEMAVAGTSGYTAASSNTEVQLRAVDDNESDYVTTLSPRGSSKSIVGVSHVDASNATPGAWNTLTVSLLPDGQTRASNKALNDSLRGRYSHLSDIATDKLQIFEVTASKDGQWVMTLGRELAVSYRAYVSADGNTITLINRNGNVVAQSDGGSSSSSGDDGTLVPVRGTDLVELTTDELTQLGKAILDELLRRTGVE